MIYPPEWHLPFVERTLGFKLNAANVTRRLVPHVTKLSAYLRDVRARSDEGNTFAYLQHPSARDAYFAYFSTVNALKLIRPLTELRQSGFFERDIVRVLDLGCGTGTVFTGLAAWIDQEGIDSSSVAYHGADIVRENLKFTAHLRDCLEEISDIRFQGFYTSALDITEPPALQSSYDLIVLMNVLNEIPESKRHALLPWLESHLSENGAVLMLDPALKDTSRDLLRLRNFMCANGWTVYSPCHRQADCPALRNAKDWCHAEDDWLRPKYIEQIDKEVGLVKLSLKYSYFLMNRSGATLASSIAPGAEVYRSVSETFHEKGRTRAWLCGESGRDQYLFNHRDKTQDNRAIQKLERYDSVVVDNAVRRAGDIVIGKESRIRRLKLD